MKNGFGPAFGLLVKKKRGELKISGGELGKHVFADRANLHEDVLKQDVSKLETGKINSPHARLVAQYRAAFDSLGNPITDEEMAIVRGDNSQDAALLSAFMERNAALGRELHLKDKLVEAIVMRYLPGSWQGFDAAIAQIEAVLRLEANQRALPLSNSGADLEQMRAQVRALNDENRLDEGQAAIAQAIAEEKTVAKERLFALHTDAVDQARRRNDPQTAAEAVIERVTLDLPPNPFDALRVLQDTWYETGRSKGIKFDLEVALHIATKALARASKSERTLAKLNVGLILNRLGESEISDQRLRKASQIFREILPDVAQNHDRLTLALTQTNLGRALGYLGARQISLALVFEAITVHRRALEILTSAKSPQHWADAQNDLGNALKIVGEREESPKHLRAAIASYRKAMKVRTSSSLRLDWAATQNNLGTVLGLLGKFTRDPEKLREAIDAYCEAFKTYTRSATPLHWAMSQNNLGVAQRVLGELLEDPKELEASRIAFETALLERTLSNVPFDWAVTQWNLADLALVCYDLAPDPALLRNAHKHALAARAVFAAGSRHQTVRCDDLLAKIAAHESR
jgi:tetratricopeptide (TPR) repeat protein